MKIEFETEDDVGIDYCLTELENSLKHLGVKYSLKCDDVYYQAKYGQEFEK